MLPILQLGPLALPVPSLVLLLGVWIGLYLAGKYAPRFGVEPGLLENMVWIGLIAGLVSARLAYVARFPDAFAGNPLSALTPRPIMLDAQSGLLFGTLAALIYEQRKHVPFWPALDALTPALMVFAAALGLSQLASGSAFGSPTHLPWGIYLWGESRHPTQVYEILATAAIAAALWPRGAAGSRPAGTLFLTFLALTAAAQIVIVTFRGDSPAVFGGVRLAQVAAWLALAFSLWQLGKRRVLASPGNQASEREPIS